MAQDINADDQLKQLSALEGANGYVIFNESGIPLKRHEKSISHEKAVHIAALVSDLWNVSKKVIQRDLKTPENDIEVIRLRTKHSYEYIITQSGDFTMLAIQLCGKAIEEAKKAAAAAAAAAVVQEENKEKEKK
ncbi:dynein light chain roadblock-type 2 protein (macronuclear) [Tetrahymena thermophila SB210]|uniref:Dynein light chain 7 n=3 Tax=Tetrahymena thermophila TaxID=5911 RepID=DYL7_TETTS|nr:dynein light chain roadblock-type 2 protein [Tetrahymena thermophila SB210]6ZYW_F Chain F, Dynein light chain roadblock-type 2 protein [Tetrahymena thermophila SB210]7KEK_F Chain F, Dynein light chain roadblock LC7A [Tetrahymena thermophila]7MOQ_F Chain F, Dynein light chain roadblock-type 2 protein [Tetrahymena thermophila CU428]8BWY_F Chain F, Dynein light chain roadblock-type 2 protein [Chlamydomonas reinhardtii]8BX8_F Chain F, Dynein light chain roadblock-type 2 protein [Tetrahymena the|eukprot:XP_001023020.3 dynein light chain roadblock-type 2 protein [Tetrahymena thermophila SB210]